MTSVTCTNSAGLCQRAVGRFNTVLYGFATLAIVSEFNHQSGRLKMYKYRGCLQLSSRHFTNFLNRTLVDSTFIA